MPYLFISICSLNTAFYLLLHVIIHKHHFIDIYWSSTMCWWVFLAIKQSSWKKKLKNKTSCSQRTYIHSRRMCVRLSFHRVQLFTTPWTVTPQTPLSMGFSRQESWNGLLVPSPGDFPEPGIEPASLASSALAGRFFTSWAIGEALKNTTVNGKKGRKSEYKKCLSLW